MIIIFPVSCSCLYKAGNFWSEFRVANSLYTGVNRSQLYKQTEQPMPILLSYKQNNCWFEGSWCPSSSAFPPLKKMVDSSLKFGVIINNLVLQIKKYVWCGFLGKPLRP